MTPQASSLQRFAKKKTTRNASLIPLGHSSLALSAIRRKMNYVLSYERRPVRANSEIASVKAKGSKTERHRQQA